MNNPDYNNPYPEPYQPSRFQTKLGEVMSGQNIKTIVMLFILTFMSTFAAGYYFNNNSLAAGAWYSVGIMSILFSHEMGHYLMCKKHRMPATLPYFLPLPPPLNPFGTLGAVIRMRGRMIDRKMLFDIGAGGPIAGMIFVLPALFWGLSMSEVRPPTQMSEYGMFLGESLLFKGIAWLTLGDVASTHTVILHPLAYAGWAGLFVTALNLLPIGQLDGGHVLYALFGEKTRMVYPVIMAGFCLICIHIYYPWLLFVGLLLWIGFRHPPTLNAVSPLDLKRKILAWLMFVLFVVSFMPTPISINVP